MNTLLLTSSGSFVTDVEHGFLSKPLAKMNLAYITTASKSVRSLDYMKRRIARMNELNYKYEEIDIEGKTESELRKILKDKEAVYVEGGNTFYLLRAVRESGFENVIKDLINQGVLYIGSSAGSYICCPTIEMATWKDPDKFDRVGITDFTAMNFVPFLMTVHYKPEYKEILKEKIPQTEYPVKILTDEQALLVKDGEVELVGEGGEIKLASI